jgi:hypothetical protein
MFSGEDHILGRIKKQLLLQAHLYYVEMYYTYYLNPGGITNINTAPPSGFFSAQIFPP